MEKLKLVVITWVDAETSDGWDNVKDIEAAAPIVFTVGFVVAESNEAIVVASTVDRDGKTCNGRMTIPLGMVLSMDELDAAS